MGRLTGTLGAALLCIAIFAGMAVADVPDEVDHIGLYLTPDASECVGPIGAGDPVTLHVLAVLPNIGDGGLVAAEFRIAGLPPIGAGGSYQADWNSDLVIGNPEEGIAIAFSEVLYGSVIELGTLTFAANSDDWVGENHSLHVDQSLDSGLLVVVNGNYDEIDVDGSYFTFNCTDPESCDCLLTPVQDCVVSPPSIDFGGIPVGESIVRTFTITNTGETILEGFVTETCDDFYILSGGFHFTLLPDQSHVVTVGYVPLESGDHLCVIETGLENCSQVICTGNSWDPVPICDISPEILHFGDTDIGESSYLFFQVRNDGGGILSGEISAVCDHFEILSGNGPFALGAGVSLTVNVRFQPTEAGEHECLILTGADNDCPDVFAHGMGMEPPLHDVDHIGLYFVPDASVCDAPIGAGESVTLHVLAVLPNLGDDGLVAAEFRIAGLPENGNGGAYSATWNSPLVLGTIEEGLSIAFTEVQYGEVIELGTLSFFSSDSDWMGDDFEMHTDYALDSGRMVIVNDQYETVDVAGSYFTFNCTILELCDCQRYISPDCIVSPLDLNFGYVPVGEHHDRVFTITNSGDTDLEGVVTEACDHFWIQEGAGVYSLSPGQVHSVTIRYQPSAGGDHVCVVETGLVVCSDVLCTGTSWEPIPICDIAPGSLEFGSADIGETVYRSFVVRNVGEGILNGEISADCDHFQVMSGGGPFALDENDAWPVSVAFQPIEIGEHECLILTGTGNDCPDVPCHGVGLPGNPFCQVIPDNFDFGDLQAGETSTFDIEITNAGTGILSGNVSPIDPPFEIYAGAGPFALLPGETHVAGVRFAPTACGGFTELVELGTGLCDGVPIVGRGIPEGGATDHIGVYADTAGEICNADLTVGETTTLHLLSVVECFAENGITRATFRIENVPTAPGGVSEFTWFADTVSGDPATGITLNWDLPQTGEILELGTLSLTPEQSDWVGQDHIVTIAATEPDGDLLIVDHLGNAWNVLGDRLTLNCVDGLCECIDFGVALCVLDPAEIDFGDVPLGDVVFRDFYVANAGFGILEGDLSVEGYGYTLEGGGGPFTLSHGDTLHGTVRFEVEDCGGNYNGDILTGLDECPGIPCHATIPPPAPDEIRQAPVIGVFEDESATICNGEIELYVTKTVYVYAVLSHIPAITAAEFRIDNFPESGPGGIVTANWNTPLVIGDPGWGIALAFSPAIPGPLVFLGSITFFMLDENWIGSDYEMWVMASNDSDKLVVVDHCFEEIDAVGYRYTFNCSWICPCEAGSPVFLSSFEMEDLGGAARFEWESADSPGAEFRLDAEMGEASWQVEHEQTTPGLYEARDDSPALLDGGEVSYTLWARGEGEEWTRVRQADLTVSPVEIATRLLSPHPNPFNPAVTIPFSLASGSKVKVTIFDVAGRLVTTLVDGNYPRGRHTIEWRGRDDADRPLPSGVYFARMEAADYGANRKLILLR